MNQNQLMNQPLLNDHPIENQENHNINIAINNEDFALDLTPQGICTCWTLLVSGFAFIVAGSSEIYTDNKFNYSDSCLISTGVFFSAAGINAIFESGTRVSKLMRKVMVGSLLFIGGSVTGMIAKEEIHFPRLGF